MRAVSEIESRIGSLSGGSSAPDVRQLTCLSYFVYQKRGVWCDALYSDDGPSGCIAIFSVRTLIFCVAVLAFCARSGQSELRAIRIPAGGGCSVGVTSCETLTMAA